MFNYPYGDNQQINLNWIISEIIALHQRLDPDYTAPTFTQIYPFSDTQQLNLDWILTELKALKDLAPTPPPTEEIDEVGQALIAGAYDADTSYQKNDYIVQDGKLYRANAATTGTFDPTKWNEVLLGDDLAIITRWADATNTYLNNLAASNVANDSSVTGTTVKDALDTLKNDVSGMTTDDVSNESDVTGTTATDALNNLNGAITSLENSSASVDWAPSSGDTLLAFIIANITDRNRLPFSFVKRTSNTVSDVPTNFQSIEFTGVVFGSGDRLTVLISKYGSGHDEVYTRNIYQNEFYGSWHAVTIPIISNISAGSLLTAGTHITISGATYYKIGQIVCWELSLTTTGAVAVGETLVSGLNTPFFSANGFPVSFMYDQGNPNEIRLCRLNSGGNLESCVAISSSGINIRITLVYAASA